jgi:hypothetical protein
VLAYPDLEVGHVGAKGVVAARFAGNPRLPGSEGGRYGLDVVAVRSPVEEVGERQLDVVFLVSDIERLGDRRGCLKDRVKAEGG